VRHDAVDVHEAFNLPRHPAVAEAVARHGRHDDFRHVRQLGVLVADERPFLRGVPDGLLLEDHQRLGLEGGHRPDERLPRLGGFPAFLERHQALHAIQVGSLFDGDAEQGAWRRVDGGDCLLAGSLRGFDDCVFRHGGLSVGPVGKDHDAQQPSSSESRRIRATRRSARSLRCLHVVLRLGLPAIGENARHSVLSVTALVVVLGAAHGCCVVQLAGLGVRDGTAAAAPHAGNQFALHGRLQPQA
jgi:hypothetical protein